MCVSRAFPRGSLFDMFELLLCDNIVVPSTNYGDNKEWRRDLYIFIWWEVGVGGGGEISVCVILFFAHCAGLFFCRNFLFFSSFFACILSFNLARTESNGAGVGLFSPPPPPIIFLIARPSCSIAQAISSTARHGVRHHKIGPALPLLVHSDSLDYFRAAAPHTILKG